MCGRPALGRKSGTCPFARGRPRPPLSGTCSLEQVLTPCVAGFMSGSQKRTAPVGAGKAGAHQPPGTQPRGALPMIVHPPAVYAMDSSDSSAGQGLPPGPGGAALAPPPLPPHPYPLVNAALRLQTWLLRRRRLLLPLRRATPKRGKTKTTPWGMGHRYSWPSRMCRTTSSKSKFCSS